MAFKKSSFKYLLLNTPTVTANEFAPSHDAVQTGPLSIGEMSPSQDSISQLVVITPAEMSPSWDAGVASCTDIQNEFAPSFDTGVTIYGRLITKNEFAPSLDIITDNLLDNLFGMCISVSTEINTQYGTNIQVSDEADDLYQTLIPVGAPLLAAIASLTGGDGSLIASSLNPLHPIIAVNGQFVTVGDGTFPPPLLTNTSVLVLYSIADLFSF